MAKKQKSPDSEEEPTPLLDLAAARLVKMGVDLNTKCVTIFLTQSKISYKPRIMHKFCRFDKKFLKFTPTPIFSLNSKHFRKTQGSVKTSYFGLRKIVQKGPVSKRFFPCMAWWIYSRSGQNHRDPVKSHEGYKLVPDIACPLQFFVVDKVFLGPGFRLSLVPPRSGH